MINYDTMTQKDFDEHLMFCLQDVSAQELLSVPGVYTHVAEEYNNAVLESWEESLQLNKEE